MTANRLLFPFLFLCCISVFALQTASQPDCETVEYIEDLNKGALERVAHIKGENAIVFIALDPIWSAPEFHYEGYRDEHFIAAVKDMRKALVNAGIDEVVVWRLPRQTLGVAMPFKDGCGVSGYGEPDLLEKLMLMHETFLLISQHGVDHASVRHSIKRLIMASRYAVHYKDEMIDIIIENLCPLITKKKSSHSNE